MKKIFLSIIAIAGTCIISQLSICHAQGQTQANDKLLKILKDKGIITDQQINEIKKDSMKDINVQFKNGFKTESNDAGFSIQLGGKIRTDFRYYGDNQTPDTFDMRKASISVKGTIFNDYDYKLSTDFSSGTAKLKDAYIRYKLLPVVNLKAGQFTYPFGYERQISSRVYPFMERSIATSGLTSSRDRGLGVEGNSFNGILYYEAGIFNGTGSNSTNNNSDFDYAGRLILHPPISTTAEAQKGKLDASLGLSYSWGKQQGLKSKDINLKTETKSGITFFTAEIPTDEEYKRDKKSAGLTVLYGSSMLNGEYIRTDYKFGKQDNITGGYVAVTHILTGEHRFIKTGKVAYEEIKRPLDIAKGQWGMWELGVRYSWFKIGDKFFEDNGLYPGWKAVDVKKNVNKGTSLDTAVSWRLQPMTRIVANYVYTKTGNDMPGGSADIFTRDNGSKTNVENAFLMRFQLEF